MSKNLDEHLPKIKDIFIELHNYSFFHSPSQEQKTDKRFIGRKRLINRLRETLINTETKSGAYLITGFRGMGKTSVVNQVLNEIKGKQDNFPSVRFFLGFSTILIFSCLIKPIFIGCFVLFLSVFIILSKASHFLGFNRSEKKNRRDVPSKESYQRIWLRNLLYDFFSFRLSQSSLHSYRRLLISIYQFLFIYGLSFLFLKFNFEPEEIFSSHRIVTVLVFFILFILNVWGSYKIIDKRKKSSLSVQKTKNIDYSDHFDLNKQFIVLFGFTFIVFLFFFYKGYVFAFLKARLGLPFYYSSQLIVTLLFWGLSLIVSLICYSITLDEVRDQFDLKNEGVLKTIRDHINYGHFVSVKINLAQDDLKEIDVLRLVARNIHSKYNTWYRSTLPLKKMVWKLGSFLLVFLFSGVLYYFNPVYQITNDLRKDGTFSNYFPSQRLFALDSASFHGLDTFFVDKIKTNHNIPTIDSFVRIINTAFLLEERVPNDNDRQFLLSLSETKSTTLPELELLIRKYDPQKRLLSLPKSKAGKSDSLFIVFLKTDTALTIDKTIVQLKSYLEKHTWFKEITIGFDYFIFTTYLRFRNWTKPILGGQNERKNFLQLPVDGFLNLSPHFQFIPRQLDYWFITLFLFLFFSIKIASKYRVLGIHTHKSVMRSLDQLIDHIDANIIKEQTMNFSQYREARISLFSKGSKKSYPIIGAKTIENRLINILDEINSIPSLFVRPTFIFIFDELDKIEPHYNVTIADKEEEELSNFGNENGHVEKTRKRQEIIAKILSNLKHFLNTAKAKFIFIAGREMYEASLADISDRDSSIGSIFHDVFYVNSFFTDLSDGKRNDITSMTENYVCQFLLPGNSSIPYQWGYTLEAYNEYLKTELKLISKEKRLKILTTLNNFITYLTFRSNGAPKKITHLFEQSVERITRRIIANVEDKYLIGGGGKNELYLKFDYEDQYRLGLTTYLFTPFFNSINDRLIELGDKLLVSTSFLIDHIYKFHNYGFSWRNLELTPEIVAINKAPDLRDFLNQLLQFLTNNHVREILSGLYGFRFNRKIISEIRYVSSISDVEAAAFNFTLDESLEIKRHHKKRLTELRKHYSKNSMYGKEHIHSIAFVHMILGDLHFYDQEYDEAILQYMDAVQMLRNYEAKDIGIYHFILLLRNMLKLGLTFEKKRSYDSAYMTYGKLVSLIIGVREVDLDKLELQEFILKREDIPKFLLKNYKTLIQSEKFRKFEKSTTKRTLIIKEVTYYFHQFHATSSVNKISQEEFTCIWLFLLKTNPLDKVNLQTIEQLLKNQAYLGNFIYQRIKSKFLRREVINHKALDFYLTNDNRIPNELTKSNFLNLWVYIEFTQFNEVDSEIRVTGRSSAFRAQQTAFSNSSIETKAHKSGLTFAHLDTMDSFHGFSDEFFSRTFNNYQIDSEKEKVLFKTSFLEGLKLVYQPLLARLQIIEKGGLGGITKIDVERNIKRFEFIIQAIKEKEKFLIRGEYFGKLGDILYYKNGFLYGVGKTAFIDELPKAKKTFLEALFYFDIEEEDLKNVTDYKAPIDAYENYMTSLCIMIERLIKYKIEGELDFEKYEFHYNFLKKRKEVEAEMIDYVFKYIMRNNAFLDYPAYGNSAAYSLANGLSDIGDTLISFVTKGTSNEIRKDFFRTLLNLMQRRGSIQEMKFGEEIETFFNNKTFFEGERNTHSTRRNTLKSKLNIIEQALCFYYLAAHLYRRTNRYRQHYFQLLKFLYVINEYCTTNKFTTKVDILCRHSFAEQPNDNKSLLKLMEKHIVENAKNALLDSYDHANHPRFSKIPNIFEKEFKTSQIEQEKIKYKNQINNLVTISEDFREMELLFKTFQLKCNPSFENGYAPTMISPYTNINSHYNRILELNNRVSYNYHFLWNKFDLLKRIRTIKNELHHLKCSVLTNDCGNSIIEIEKQFDELINFGGTIPVLEGLRNDFINFFQLDDSDRLNSIDYQKILKQDKLCKNKEKAKLLFEEINFKFDINFNEICLLCDHEISFNGKNRALKEVLWHLIKDSIYCLVKILKTHKIFGVNYASTNHFSIASAHERLAEWSELFKKFTDESSLDKLILEAELIEILDNQDLAFIDPKYQREMALRHYYAVLEMHNEGKAYKDFMDNLFYLDDDFNDNLMHFSFAFERYNINTGTIRRKITKLRKKIEN